jgi:CRP/FNR family transcriptional regulator/CRP/FNR family cyclic AMP-dependent transcriptional regulator
MTSDGDRLEHLHNVEMFHALSKEQLERVAALASDLEVSAGEPIIQEDDDDPEGASLFVIVDGQAEVIAAGRKVARLNPGDSFGELSLLDGKPRGATVRSLTDMRLLTIHSKDFRELLHSEPGMAFGLLEFLADWLRAARKAMSRSH